jgi:hypothetical protein
LPRFCDIGPEEQPFDSPLILSLSKDEPLCSWFDKLTTSDGNGDLTLAMPALRKHSY